MSERPSFGFILRKALKTWWILMLMYSFVDSAYKDDGWLHAYLNINWPLMVIALGLLVLVASTAVVLRSLHPKIMEFSILSFFNAKGKNISLIGTDIKYLGVVMCLLLMAALPRFALLEEEIFREGTVDWYDGIYRSILFGLVHMVVGVPLYAALAISIGGIGFTYMYFEGGVALSAQLHFQYNLIPVTLLLILAIIKCFSKEKETDDSIELE